MLKIVKTIEIPFEIFKSKISFLAQKNIEKSNEYSMGCRVNVNQDKYE